MANGLMKEFISEEKREFKVRLGTAIASALAGFVAGVISASIIFVTLLGILTNNQ